MSRYIDADALPRHGKRGGVVYWRDIEAQPPADVVEVVRCKDCKWWKPFNDKMGDCGYDMKHKDQYCDRGERADT